MYIDTYAVGEARTELAILTDAARMGKSPLLAHRFTDPVATPLRGTVPSSIAVHSDVQISGTILPGEDFDVHALSVVAGQTYSVALRGIGADGLDDPLIALFDQEFDLVNYDDDGGVGITSLLTFTAAATGTYYLTAQSFAPGDIGDYTIDIWAQPAADQVPATFAGAVTIAAGTTFGHIESSADIDTYKVFLEAGGVYIFQLAGGTDYATDPDDVPPGELDTILALYAPNGTRIAFNDDADYPSDTSSAFFYIPQQSGYYYLDVTAYEDQTGGYTLDVSQVDPTLYDPVDAVTWFDADNIQTVDVGGMPTAYVYFGDSDENFGQLGDDGDPMVTIDWNAFEKQQIMAAFEEYTRILGIDYVVTEDVDQATFRLLKTESQQYGAYFYPQDPGLRRRSGRRRLQRALRPLEHSGAARAAAGRLFLRGRCCTSSATPMASPTRTIVPADRTC